MPLSKTILTILAIMSLATAGTAAQAQTWPAITQQARPWARWWWPGSAVNEHDLSRNMESYRAAGLGGLEVTPIYGVKGRESEFIPFLSPRWMQVFNHTLHEAQRLNMGIDLANATGWPFGGPWVSDADASKELFWKTYEVKGGQPFTDTISYIQPPLVRADGQAPDISTLVQPISANKNLQTLALDQVRFKKPLPLAILMAYNDKGTAINLTNRVNAQGKLNWTAPAGSNWQLYALFEGWHGKMVERAAPGGEGLVIDHFSKPALAHYLARFNEAFKNQKLTGLRAFFNDSYEVDDARGQANFTPQLFSEFLKRRGYDLRNHLPALLDGGNADTGNRILCDYRQTISELLLDNFTQPWHAWGKARGALIRNQSHGSPSNILDLYAAVDIPETEGNDVLRFKFATSAAHVSGKPLASSESATWLNDHFLSSLGDVKQAIDDYFTGGVNHIFFHGVCYSPQNAAWPGWLFYAAVHFNQTNPFWPHFSTLNGYIARCQSFLQQGKPDNDVLVYYPLYDSFSERGKALLKHYDALKPDFNNTGFAQASEQMLKTGYTFDFISDRQLLASTAAGSTITTGGGTHYKTILLPGNRYMPAATLNKVLALARAGATIVVYKNLPADVPGYGDLAAQRRQFKHLLSALHFTNAEGVQSAPLGKGHVLLGDDLDKLLAAAHLRREAMTDAGLQFVRRKSAQGYTYFIVNKQNKVFAGWVTLAIKASAIALFNPMTQTCGMASVKNSSGQTAVYLQLQPGQSCLLQTGSHFAQAKPLAYYQPQGKATVLNGNWTISFLSGGPSLPVPLHTRELKSWTELGGADAQSFSGMASYVTIFARPAGRAAVWQLNLGRVHESAEVYLNGARLATLLGPVYTVNIPNNLLKDQNRLELRITNLMANRIIDMDKKQMPYKIFYNTNFQAHDKANRGPDGLFTAANWQPKLSGLLGPVSLQPLVKTDPQ